MSLATDPQKILIARGDMLGDVVLATPVIEALHNRYPKAQLYLLVQDGFRKLFSQDPRIAGCLIDPLPYQLRRQDWPAFFKLVSQIKAEGFDCFIGLWERPRYALLSALARIPLRVGHGFHWLNRLCYHRSTTFGQFMRHQAKWNLSVAALVAPVTFQEPAQLFPATTPLIFPTSSYLILSPDSKSTQKRLTEAHYVHAAQWALNHTDLTLVLVGETANMDPCPTLLDLFKANPNRCLDWTNQLNLDTLVALTSKAELVFAADAGLVHIAAALQRRVLTYYLNRTQNVLRWGPWQTPHRVLISQHDCTDKCDSLSCKKWDCRLPIPRTEIETALQDLLQDAPLPAPSDSAYRLEKGLIIGLFRRDFKHFEAELQNRHLRYFVLEEPYTLSRLCRHINNHNCMVWVYRSPWSWAKLAIAREITSNHNAFKLVIRTQLPI
ncbi:MAG: glycosyltransferase family 9 protein [Candidatus Margulisiibacteriota bacterium]